MSQEPQPNNNLSNGAQEQNNPSAYPSFPQPPIPDNQANVLNSPPLNNQNNLAVPAKKSDLKKVIIGIIIVIIIFIIIGFLLSVMAKPALQTQANNTAIENNVSMLAVAVNDYQAKTSGIFPVSISPDTVSGTADICGVSCSNGTKIPVQLSFFKPDSISIQNYSSKLKVPNVNTAYVVSNSFCNSSKTGIGQQSNGSNFVVLYAIQAGSSPEQKCLQY